MKYSHASYGISFQAKSLEPVYEKLNWFQRVILRRKPRVITIDTEVCRSLAQAARKYEDELINQLFNGGLCSPDSNTSGATQCTPESPDRS